jgi:hypothetical protein
MCWPPQGFVTGVWVQAGQRSDQSARGQARAGQQYSVTDGQTRATGGTFSTNAGASSGRPGDGVGAVAAQLAWAHAQNAAQYDARCGRHAQSLGLQGHPKRASMAQGALVRSVRFGSGKGYIVELRAGRRTALNAGRKRIPGQLPKPALRRFERAQRLVRSLDGEAPQGAPGSLKDSGRAGVEGPATGPSLKARPATTPGVSGERRSCAARLPRGRPTARVRAPAVAGPSWEGRRAAAAAASPQGLLRRRGVSRRADGLEGSPACDARVCQTKPGFVGVIRRAAAECPRAAGRAVPRSRRHVTYSSYVDRGQSSRLGRSGAAQTPREG